MSKCTYCPVRKDCPGVRIDFTRLEKEFQERPTDKGTSVSEESKGQENHSLK